MGAFSWGEGFLQTSSLILSDLERTLQMHPLNFVLYEIKLPFTVFQRWRLAIRIQCWKPPTAEMGVHPTRLTQEEPCLDLYCSLVSLLLFQLPTASSLNRANRLAQRRYPTQPCWVWPSAPGPWGWPPTHSGLIFWSTAFPLLSTSQNPPHLVIFRPLLWACCTGSTWISLDNSVV